MLLDSKAHSASYTLPMPTYHAVTAPSNPLSPSRKLPSALLDLQNFFVFIPDTRSCIPLRYADPVRNQRKYSPPQSTEFPDGGSLQILERHVQQAPGWAWPSGGLSCRVHMRKKNINRALYLDVSSLSGQQPPSACLSQCLLHPPTLSMFTLGLMPWLNITTLTLVHPSLWSKSQTT